MAIAHICTGCGLDLARHRPALEAHYGLRIVTCSRCGRAACRRRHPVDRAWRGFLRLKSAILSLLLRALLLAIFTSITVPLVHAFALEVMRTSLAIIWENDRLRIVLTFIAFPIVTGIWLGVAFRHWRTGTQWPAWAAWIFMIGWVLPPLFEALVEGGIWQPWMNSYQWRLSMIALASFGVMWCVSWLALPIAAIFARAGEHNRRVRWRKRRQRFRKRRLGR